MSNSMPTGVCARSKSGRPLAIEQIAEEIKRVPGETRKDIPALLQARGFVKSYIEKRHSARSSLIGEEPPKGGTTYGRDSIPGNGAVHLGAYTSFYGASLNGELYVDSAIIDSPLQLELTLLALGLAGDSSADHMDEETDYVRWRVSGQGKYELSKIGDTIANFLRERSPDPSKGRLERLRDLFSARNSGQLAEADFEKAVTDIVDAVNSFDRIPSERIGIAPISQLEDFKEIEKWRAVAEQTLVDGGLAFEAFYAGAGERMGRGALYGLDAWAVLDDYLRLPDHKLGDYKVPSDAIRGIGLGPRQLLQLRICLEELARKRNVDPRATLSRFVIVLHVNSQVKAMVRQDLLLRRHYGFDPKNVIIVPQPVLPGWSFDTQGNLALNPRSKTLPYNHGWARMQLNWRGQAYWMDPQGQDHALEDSVADYLLKNGIRYLSLNRVNDLDRISPKGILDVDLIALSLYLMREKGYSLTVELVGNDTGQKGGLGLAEAGSEEMFLVETLCAKSPQFAQRMDRLTEEFRDAQGKKNAGIPYNAMRQIEDIQATKKPLEAGLPVVIRFREKHIYLEVPTGDLTNLDGVRTRAVMRMHDRFNPDIRDGELIYDFKRLEDAYKAPLFLHAQEAQPRFRALAKELFP